ncbi:MAG: hypothetical protein LBC92_03915, partial [Rickettsiales bacterium]|nr:hypothetical protein [Rickettsiales bacterium]
MSKELVIKRLQNALKMNLYNQIRTVFPSIHPENQAELIERISAEDRKKLIYILGDRIKPHLLIKLSPKIKYEVIGYLNESQLADIVIKLLHKKIVVEDLEEDIKTIDNQKDNTFNTVIDSVYQRTFWLIINVFLMAITSLMVDKFENVLQKFTVISILIPIISTIATNAEAQTCVILIR